MYWKSWQWSIVLSVRYFHFWFTTVEGTPSNCCQNGWPFPNTVGFWDYWGISFPTLFSEPRAGTISFAVSFLVYFSEEASHDSQIGFCLPNRTEIIIKLKCNKDKNRLVISVMSPFLVILPLCCVSYFLYFCYCYWNCMRLHSSNCDGDNPKWRLKNPITYANSRCCYCVNMICNLFIFSHSYRHLWKYNGFSPYYIKK